MTIKDAIRFLDPETSKGALLPYAYDSHQRRKVVDEACRVAVDVMGTRGPIASSLCWQCKKAKPGQGCCWIDCNPSGFVPVPGQQTIKRRVVQGRGKGIVHIVQACPQFEEG